MKTKENEIFQLVPKPRDTKKKKTVNGWKDKASRYCYYCGTSGAERHEIYGGPSRQTSIDLRFQLDLCTKCHREWHESDFKEWEERRQFWRSYYQQKYENKLKDNGIREDQARECWMQLIGRNYLE